MSADNQQYMRGRLGKLTSQQLNAQARTAQHSRNDLETTPTPFAREGAASAGAWPMIARVGAPVFNNSVVVGFEWTEAHYVNNSFVTNQEGRAYVDDEEQEDRVYCVPMGVPFEQYGSLDIEGSIVQMNYTFTQDGPLLYFDPPSSASNVAVLQITASHTGGSAGGALTPYCQGFAANRRYECVIVDADPEFFTSGDFGTAAPPLSEIDNNLNAVYAYNLLEYNDGALGGEQQVNDCNIDTRLATLPVGTRVLGYLLGQWEERASGDGQDREESVVSRAYAFSVVNDTCVQCCIEEGRDPFARSTYERGARSVERRTTPVSAYSIRDEMMR